VEIESYARFVLALAAVLGLIGLLAFAARRFGLMPGAVAGGGKGRRLGVVEAMPLDGKRRLVLIRRDEREHLIMLSPGDGPDLVIERDIAARPPENREMPS
jgi:flagellar protein FliO/FliZ